MLYLAVKKNNFTLAAVLLGLGAGFKIFPLLFMVPLAFVKPNLLDRIKLLLTSVITYVLFAYPFLWSKGFRMTAALANQTTKSFYANVPVSGGESIILFLAAVIFFTFFFLQKNFSRRSMEKIFCNDFSIFHLHPLSSSMVFVDHAVFCN